MIIRRRDALGSTPVIGCRLSILIMVVGLIQLMAGTPLAKMVELPAVIHFLTPSGEDVEVGPGAYEVEMAESWLKLVPTGQAGTEAVLLEATSGTHQETLEKPVLRLEEESDNPDAFHLAMLLPDGTGLEAIGTMSGIRPRGMYLSYLKRPAPKPATQTSRFGLALPKVGSGQQAPPPRPQSTCGPVRHWEVGRGSYGRPTLAVFRNKLHLVKVSVDKNWLDPVFGELPQWRAEHYIYDGTRWSFHAPVHELTGLGRVALAVYNGNLWAVWRDKDKQLRFSRYYDQWAPPTKIPGQFSKSMPALAVRGGVLHMVHNGKSSDDLWHSTFTPQTQWTKNVKIGQKSRTTPGLATGSDGNLHMVYLGPGKRGRPDPKDLWYSQSNGRRWTKATKIPKQYSKASPTLLGAGTTSRLLPVLMVHLGRNKNTLWQSFYGKNPRLPEAG